MKEFIELVKKKDFKNAVQLIAKTEFNANFVDENGDGLMHICINSLLAFLKSLAKNQDSNRAHSHEKLTEMLDSETENFEILIKVLLNKGVPYYIKNKNGKLPLDVFLDNIASFEKVNRSIAIHNCLDVVKEMLVGEFDKRGSFLSQGRKYVCNLSLFRGNQNPKKRSEIPNRWDLLDKQDGGGLSLHQRQFLYANYLIENDIITNGNSLNYLIANMGFLIKNADDKNRDAFFITVPIKDKDYITLRSDSFGTKASPDFFQTFPGYDNNDHSECGLIKYLNNPANIECLIDMLVHELKTFCPKVNTYKIQAVVLDVYTKEECCLSCETRLRFLQTNYADNSFLKKLQIVLLNNRFDLPKKHIDRFRSDRSIKYDVSSDTLHFPLILRVNAKFPTATPGFLPNNDCFPHICEEYPADIKLHDLPVMLHAVPAKKIKLGSTYWSNKETHSQFFDPENFSNEKNIEKNVSKLKNKSFFLCPQTVFLNSVKAAKMLSWEESRVDPKKMINVSPNEQRLESTLQHW